jgi:hypothetical protein
MRNSNQSQTYNKFKVKSNNVNAESNSFRKARVSSKNVLRSNNPHGITLIRPLEDQKNHFNYESRI